MAHPAYLREKARALRVNRKLTIDELAERLALSRSTIYYWVRDLPIPRSRSGGGGGWPASARAAAVRANKRKYRRLREAAYAEGAASFDALMLEAGFRDFICLYIAEGYKRSRNEVGICNSDEAVLLVALSWLRRLTSRPLAFSIQYHCDQDLGEVCSFWGKTLGIDPGAIRLQRKSNSGRLNGRQWRSRHGVLTIRVADRYLRARLQAWIDRISGEWSEPLGLDSVGAGRGAAW